MHYSIICIHSNLPLKVSNFLPFKNAQLRIFIWRMHVATFLPSLQMIYNQKQSEPHIWVYHSSFSIWADHIKSLQRLVLESFFTGAFGKCKQKGIWTKQIDIHMTFLNVFCRLSAEIHFFLFHQLYTKETKVMPDTRSDLFMPSYSCRSCGQIFPLLLVSTKGSLRVEKFQVTRSKRHGSLYIFSWSF